MKHLNNHTNHVNETDHQFVLNKLPIKLITHIIIINMVVANADRWSHMTW